MAWQTIIQASSVEEAEAAKLTIADIPAGSKVRITVEFAWYMPIGKIGDLAGSELWLPKLLPYDLEVTDVYGDWTWFKIEGVAKGFPVLPVVIAVCATLTLVGIAYFVTGFLIEAEITEQAKVQLEREKTAAEQEERRYEYVEWRTSPEGGAATASEAWQEVETGKAEAPEPIPKEATSLFPDVLGTEGWGWAGIGLIIVIALLFMSGVRKE